MKFKAWIPAGIAGLVVLFALVALTAVAIKPSLVPTPIPTPSAPTPVPTLVPTNPGDAGQPTLEVRVCTGDIVLSAGDVLIVQSQNFTVNLMVVSVGNGHVFLQGSDPLFVGDEYTDPDGNPMGLVTAIEDGVVHFCQYK